MCSETKKISSSEEPSVHKLSIKSCSRSGSSLTTSKLSFKTLKIWQCLSLLESPHSIPLTTQKPWWTPIDGHEAVVETVLDPAGTKSSEFMSSM